MVVLLYYTPLVYFQLSYVSVKENVGPYPFWLYSHVLWKRCQMKSC